jgi:SPASM domain peptide maturase of grasp-with-spasm system
MIDKELQNKVPKLFSNCILVKGIKNHIICDLQMQRYIQVPAEFSEVILNLDNSTLLGIEEKFNQAVFQNILSVYNVLVVKGYMHFFDEITVQRFIDLSFDWDEKCLVSNAIVDYNRYSNFPWLKIFADLQDLGCEHVQIRNFENSSLSLLSQILSESNIFSFASLSLIVKYNSQIIENVEMLVNKYSAICEIIIFSAPKDKKLIINTCTISYITESLSKFHCGNISKNYFSINIDTFTEAQNHNTCLNRKIGIDEEGNIKNCPSMTTVYGNIHSDSILSIVQDLSFQKLWNIHKGVVHKCKDCEFRFICTDCRAYRENPNDLNSAPLKCGYNPTTGIWETWSKNPLKSKVMDNYIENEDINEQV